MVQAARVGALWRQVRQGCVPAVVDGLQGCTLASRSVLCGEHFPGCAGIAMKTAKTDVAVTGQGVKTQCDIVAAGPEPEYLLVICQQPPTSVALKD